MTKVYAVAAKFTDGYTYDCTEVQHIFADKDIAEYIVEAANEKVSKRDESATTYVLYGFEVDEKTSMKQADKIVRQLLKQYNS